jgi:hypothetical protein
LRIAKRHRLAHLQRGYAITDRIVYPEYVKKCTLEWSLVVTVLLLSGEAAAKPPAGGVFCQKYPSAPECVGKQPSCTFCHVAPPQRNSFGTMVEKSLAVGMPRPLSDADFSTALPAALAAVESQDADGDGTSNLDEIQGGTLPGDPSSKPGTNSCQGGENPQYSVCRYDLRHVYKKVLRDFCGVSPTFADVVAFVARPSDDDRRTFIDAEIERCTQTEFWRGKNGQLWKVAHPKIRPVGSLKEGEDKGGVPLADYYDDYNLFAYTQTDDHDAREVLTANYFVRRDVNPTRYSKVTTLASQKVDLAHRAGNMTSAWTLSYFVMFTALPRNAASQMYRAYLGLDIAKQEGLYSVANEPQDYDAKGVTTKECAACHATLDPLTYPFRNYNGIASAKYETQYIPNRLEQFFPNVSPRIAQTPEKGAIFGKPVNNLLEWALTAVASDAFAISTTKDYWKLLVGHAPTPEENAEFVATWQRFQTANQYRVQKLLHDIVKTEAYGAP